MRTAAGTAVSIPLPDGRRLVARLPPRQRPTALVLAAFLGAIALVVALGARPVVRRLTGRLERLQRGVESLGAGDLAARVKVEGRDEVARLAQSFNQAAARIESLVNAHKTLLANASHELRTPLARIRLGLELVAAHPERKAELEGDIAELDQLVDEILLVSRLDATEQLDIREDVDLAALTAEECARYDDCALEAKPVIVSGDPMLLRRMIRSLIENAKLHGNRWPLGRRLAAETASREQREGDRRGLSAMAQDRPAALFIAADAYFFSRSDHIIAHVARLRIPAIYPRRAPRAPAS